MQGYLLRALLFGLPFLWCGLAMGAGDGITLLVNPSGSAGEYRLDWTGGQPTYKVFRSSSPHDVMDAVKQLGETGDNFWLDVPPDGGLFFYRVATTVVSCNDHPDCASEEYCSDNVCVADELDGSPCSEADQCLGGHCQNGFCCATGDCCAVAADCHLYGLPPTCDDPSSCQGTRRDAVCNAQSQCVTSPPIDDDSACGPFIQSNDCGPYAPVVCTGSADQPSDQAALCPTSCLDDLECDPGFHCDSSACVPDLPSGFPCDEPSDCFSQSCVGGFCE